MLNAFGSGEFTFSPTSMDWAGNSGCVRDWKGMGNGEPANRRVAADGACAPPLNA